MTPGSWTGAALTRAGKVDEALVALPVEDFLEGALGLGRGLGVGDAHRHDRDERGLGRDAEQFLDRRVVRLVHPLDPARREPEGVDRQQHVLGGRGAVEVDRAVPRVAADDDARHRVGDERSVVRDPRGELDERVVVGDDDELPALLVHRARREAPAVDDRLELLARDRSGLVAAHRPAGADDLDDSIRSRHAHLLSLVPGPGSIALYRSRRRLANDDRAGRSFGKRPSGADKRAPASANRTTRTIAREGPEGSGRGSDEVAAARPSVERDNATAQSGTIFEPEM